MLTVKTAFDMGLNQMAEKIGCAPQTVSPIYSALQKAWEESAPDQEVLTVAVDGETLSVQRALVGEKKLPSGGPSHFCCAESLSETFADVLGSKMRPRRHIRTPEGSKGNIEASAEC